MKVLITGGGFLGRHLAFACCLDPTIETVRVMTRSENHLAQIRATCGTFENRHGLPKYEPMLGDITHPGACHRACEGMNVIYHTAAMKHVDFCRDRPDLAIKTNVDGVRNMLETVPAGARFIFISTDKAVQPTTAYGATKLLGERLTLQAAAHGMDAMVFRGGNLFASDGSVVPRWRESLRRRNEIDLTHPEMTRWFEKVDDAVSYLLRMTTQGQAGHIYTPPMRLVRLTDLATAVCEEWAAAPGVNIRHVGLRPGEKIEEILTLDNEGEQITLLDGQAGHDTVPVPVDELRRWLRAIV